MVRCGIAPIGLCGMFAPLLMCKTPSIRQQALKLDECEELLVRCHIVW